MDDRSIMARGLAHMIFRNGAVEDLHVQEAPLTDGTMKQLNKDVYNRIYTLLSLPPDELTHQAMAAGILFGQTWDPPEEVEIGNPLELLAEVIGGTDL